MGRWPITIQTVKAKSQESVFIEEHVFVTFTTENIEPGSPIMESTNFPAMMVDFKSDNERQIFYYGKREGRPFGRWNIDSDDSWDIERRINSSLREKLRQSFLAYDKT